MRVSKYQVIWRQGGLGALVIGIKSTRKRSETRGNLLILKSAWQKTTALFSGSIKSTMTNAFDFIKRNQLNDFEDVKHCYICLKSCLLKININSLQNEKIDLGQTFWINTELFFLINTIDCKTFGRPEIQLTFCFLKPQVNIGKLHIIAMRIQEGSF